MATKKKGIRWVSVFTAKSESGDEYGPWVFHRTPTDKQLVEFLKKECPGEFDVEEPGPGAFGSYLHLCESRARVR